MNAMTGVEAARAASTSDDLRPAPRAKRARLKDAQDRIDALAEHMAEGGTLAGFAATAGVHAVTASRIWATIRRELGPQAV